MVRLTLMKFFVSSFSIAHIFPREFLHSFTHTQAVHGSQISLMSGGSSMYGSTTTEEQRQVNEVRRLKRELVEAREQVMSLSSQLSTNVSRHYTIFLCLITNSCTLHLLCVCKYSQSLFTDYFVCGEIFINFCHVSFWSHKLDICGWHFLLR